MGAKVNGIPVKVYGIPNCDQVKKARAWLEANNVIYTFHDFKKQGLSGELAANWLKAAGADRLINRQGPTWRILDEERKALVDKPSGPVAEKQTLMLDYPSVNKRPVLDRDGEITVGFNAGHYNTLFP